MSERGVRSGLVLVLLLSGPPAARAADAPGAAGAGVARDLAGVSFERLHRSAGRSDGGAVIFGALEPNRNGAGAAAELLGRWEGYDLSLPVPRDWKLVLFVEAIRGDTASVLVWMGTNLQRPKVLARVSAGVTAGSAPALTFEADVDGQPNRIALQLDRTSGRLVGTAGLFIPGGPYARSLELTRDRSFVVHRDYPAYLAGKRIHRHAYRNPALARFGPGYLVYLPPGYDASAKQAWPLILFFCGTGERGMPLEDLAKSSPLLFIREHGDLPAVIVAPGLDDLRDHRSFPTEYMAGVLDEVLADYRIDASRVAITGLSMGGEATIRFALTSPERFAAAAPLAMADPRFDRGLQQAGFVPTAIPYQRVASVPFYVVNGGRDPWVGPEAVRVTVEAMRKAGVDVRWKVLAENGHDVWTETYSDAAFYDWLLSKRR